MPRPLTRAAALALALMTAAPAVLLTADPALAEEDLLTDPQPAPAPADGEAGAQGEPDAPGPGCGTDGTDQLLQDYGMA